MEDVAVEWVVSTILKQMKPKLKILGVLAICLMFLWVKNLHNLINGVEQEFPNSTKKIRAEYG